jgi:hypothetical protein
MKKFILIIIIFLATSCSVQQNFITLKSESDNDCYFIIKVDTNENRPYWMKENVIEVYKPR